MSDTPYDLVLYQGEHATFEGQAVGSGGGSLPPEWAVAANGGLTIAPTDDLAATATFEDAAGNPILVVGSGGSAVLSSPTGVGVNVRSDGRVILAPADTAKNVQVEDYTNGDTIIEVLDPGKLAFFGVTAVTQPVVPLTTPSVQDVIDALVTLGLVAQHD